jgi:hypothetical protein
MRGKDKLDIPNVMVVDYREKSIKFKPFIYYSRFWLFDDRKFDYLELAYDLPALTVLKWVSACMKSAGEPADISFYCLNKNVFSAKVTLTAEAFPVEKFAKDKHNPYNLQRALDRKVEQMDFIVDSLMDIEVFNKYEFGKFLSTGKFNLKCVGFDPDKRDLVTDVPPIQMPVMMSINC